MLKQLLQQLLNTRTTPGGVAHSASSTYTSPQWFNGTSTVGDKWTNGLYTGTAPNDGYLNISGSAYITTENVGSMIQAQIGDGQISQVSPMSGQGFNMLFPISKGASFSVNGIRLTDITVRFFKTIGGGYNRNTFFSFGKGEKLCLKPLSNFSQKVSSRANQIGLAAKFFRSQESLSTLPLKRTQRRAMGGLSSGDFLPTFWRLMSQAEDLCSYPVLCRNTKAKGLQFLFISRSLRDRKSTCWETKPQTFCNVGLLQPLALRNLLSTGGKLC